MGQVYRAHDPRLNRDVAVKVLPPEFSTDPARKARFEQEARAVAALNHPGIVSIYDVGDGWMVTELVEGENLRQSGFTVRQIIDIGAQIADALALAHDAGISHRDLKPENVILTPDGRTKILDFGLAKFIQPPDPDAKPENVSTLTNPGSPLGTPGYMSPEQVRGQHTDQRADFFSLGTMLYEMLAGRAAFQDDSAIEVMHAIVHKDPAPLPASIPEGLRTIVLRCMEKKPAQRFQSARDLAFALRSLSNGGTAIAPLKPRAVWPYAVAAAIALLTAVYLYFGQTAVPGLESYKFTPFAYTRAQEHSGVWSPDGKSIAYLEQSSDGTRLMVQSLDATSPTELVAQVSAQQGQLAWSPDSNRIYFLGVGQQFGGVSAISRAGGAPERIVAGGSAFDVSRDGQMLALWRGAQSNGNGTRYSVWLSSPPGAELVEYKPAPFEVPTPFTPVFLRFSPDGKRLFLSVVSDRGAETWLLPIPAGAPRRIFSTIPWNRPVAASWLPDSRRLVLSGNASPAVNEQLWLADSETETLTRLLALPEAGQATPSVSPDGKQILFSQITRDRDITELPLDGSPPRTILSTDLPEFGPNWSPKGDQFAFIAQRNGTDELWVRSPEGNWERPVVTAKEFSKLQSLISPVFSPDGARIAYTALLAGGGRRRSLSISPVGGGTPTVIADGYAPTWSREGDRLAFLWLKPDGTIPLATLRVGSDDPPMEIMPPRGFGSPEWSPSGEWIAVPSTRGVELTSADGNQQKFFPGMNGAALAWSRDSKTIFGLMFQSPQPALLAMDATSGSVRKIADYDLTFQPLLENAYTGTIRLCLSPDGKSVVTATAANQADLWILDGFAH
jgi:Tol biopolymer transport system component